MTPRRRSRLSLLALLALLTLPILSACGPAELRAERGVLRMLRCDVTPAAGVGNDPLALALSFLNSDKGLAGLANPSADLFLDSIQTEGRRKHLFFQQAVVACRCSAERWWSTSRAAASSA